MLWSEGQKCLPEDGDFTSYRSSGRLKVHSFKNNTRFWQHHFNHEEEIVHPKISVVLGIRVLYVAVRTSGGIYSNIQCKPPSHIQALPPRAIQS